MNIIYWITTKGRAVHLLKKSTRFSKERSKPKEHIADLKILYKRNELVLKMDGHQAEDNNDME